MQLGNNNQTNLVLLG